MGMDGNGNNKRHLGAEVNLHHISLLQHSVVAAVRGVVGGNMINRTAGGEADAGLQTVLL
jgi:hypothetical protein